MDEDLRLWLEEAARRERPNLVQLPIRELIERWGYKRRRAGVVSEIDRDLDAAGLVTDPPFVQGWIDTVVSLVPRKLMPAPPSIGSDPMQVDRKDAAVPPSEVALIVGGLRSAGQGVCSIPLDSSLLLAQSLMMSNDYSQLAVMSGPRTLRGAVTWESIAQTSMKSPNPQVQDCVIQAEVVRFEDDLIHHIPRIVLAGYVFVEAQDRTICGIVTTADLSEEFGRLATPFFLIGEIERRLRRAVDRIFSPSELSSVRSPGDGTRDVGSAEDLTIGEYVRLLENPDNWGKTKWHVERGVFTDALDRVRALRNDVMHFSPDPLDEDQLDELRRFIRWLRFLDL